MRKQTKTNYREYNKKFILRALTVLVICIALIAILAAVLQDVTIKPVDTVDINRVVTELGGTFKAEKGKYDFTAVSADGKVIFSTVATTDETLTQRLNRAVKARDTVVDFADGKVIFYTNLQTAVVEAKAAAFWIAIAAILTGFLLAAATVIYDEIRILRPFRILKEFSQEVSNGNFDLPLKMDKGESFGAFTEAFDLLRHKLQQAKDAEKEALQTKRQLLVELSHDLKTPLATIIATAEMMDARGIADAEKIIAKANQIDKLLSDIYRNSIAEVGRLTVEPIALNTSVMLNILHTAEGACKVQYVNSPSKGCVMLDKLRFEECVDNVFGNALKYAEGQVKVEFGIHNGFIWVSFVDKGIGLEEEELQFITNKFFRGKRARAISGAGLGLHVTKSLLEKMDGFMTAENASTSDDGYTGLKITFFLAKV